MRKKSLYERFDRFCYQHESWGLRNLMLFVVAVNALVFLLSMINKEIPSILEFDRAMILKGEVWRLLTFIFLPFSPGNLLFEAIALYFYYWVGSSLEREWGRLKFTLYYLSGWIFTMVFCMATGFAGTGDYLNLALFFAFATLFPDLKILLFFVIPVKVKYLAVVEVIFVFILPFLGSSWKAVALPLVAVLNYLLYFAPHWIDFFKHRKTGQNSPRVINFKREVRRASEGAKVRGYNNKCAVCGKTDTEYPDMEFRYCSLCARYECYCAEHIFTHEHTSS